MKWDTPKGWDERSWASYLRYKAAVCEKLRPDLAGEYRAAADGIYSEARAAESERVLALMNATPRQ